LFFWRFDGFLSTGGDECARFITQNIFQTFLTGHGAVGKTAIGEATSKRSPAPPHDGAPILKEKELKEFIQLFSTRGGTNQYFSIIGMLGTVPD
jgi:hypothetical protein